jgi:hypothetical protein
MIYLVVHTPTLAMERGQSMGSPTWQCSSRAVPTTNPRAIPTRILAHLQDITQAKGCTLALDFTLEKIVKFGLAYNFRRVKSIVLTGLSGCCLDTLLDYRLTFHVFLSRLDSNGCLRQPIEEMRLVGHWNQSYIYNQPRSVLGHLTALFNRFSTPFT